MSGSDIAIEGDTVDIGYQLGALYELREKTRFGVNSRSEINHKLKGDISANGMLSSYPTYNQDITARIDTPAMLSVGAYHEINDKWAVMAEYQRVFWNSFDAIDIYGTDVPGIVSNTPENWEDTDFYSVGASYQIDNQWKLRLGLAMDEAAVKVDYRTPRVPDSRRIWYSTGLEYKYNDKLTFDMGFTYIQAKEAHVDFDKSVTGSADYENSVKIWGLSVNYKF